MVELRDTDLSPLYDSANRTSLNAQQKVLAATKSRLLFLLFGTFVAAFTWKLVAQSFDIAGILAALAFFGALIVGLSDGRFPIVIDQPEDSLDLRSIWDDVCRALRDSKERRQFIFTTHNSSVAVASDADKFIILEAGATQAKVLYSGSINSSKIRSEIIAYLEGGPDTYANKRAKYNLE